MHTGGARRLPRDAQHVLCTVHAYANIHTCTHPHRGGKKAAEAELRDAQHVLCTIEALESGACSGDAASETAQAKVKAQQQQRAAIVKKAVRTRMHAYMHTFIHTMQQRAAIVKKAVRTCMHAWFIYTCQNDAFLHVVKMMPSSMWVCRKPRTMYPSHSHIMCPLL
jgi:hypothetical protein